MMLYFLFLLCAIICYGMTLTDIRAEKGYIDRDRTDSIKGIFILAILFTHFGQYVTYTNFEDILQMRILSFFGQGVVSMFLFYSGYGVTEGVKSRGENYAKLIPKKRILETFVRFNCALLLFGVLQYCIGGNVTFFKYILAMFAWDSLGNSNWYIFTIACLYFFSWIAYRTVGVADVGKYVLMIFVLVGVYCGILHLIRKSGCWYDTAFCYWIGVVWSLYKEKFEKYLLGGAEKCIG